MSQPINVEKTLTINRPVAELYRFWHNFENLPHFMKHLKNVQVQDERRSHWVANAPLDQKVEWDAEITEERENEIIAWASTASADVRNSGFIRFQPAAPTNSPDEVSERGTEVKVKIEYNLPGGAVGDAIAKLFGESPKQQLSDDLRRFKMLMETGEIATTEGQPQGHS
jgi:uncharacterized membrane protein